MLILVIIIVLCFILRDDSSTNDTTHSTFSNCTYLFLLSMFFDDE